MNTLDTLIGLALGLSRPFSKLGLSKAALDEPSVCYFVLLRDDQLDI
jgi:hypothetical protein